MPFIRLTDAVTGDLLLINPDHVAMIAQDADDEGHRAVMFVGPEMGNAFVAETVEEIVALLKPQA